MLFRETLHSFRDKIFLRRTTIILRLYVLCEWYHLLKQTPSAHSIFEVQLHAPCLLNRQIVLPCVVSAPIDVSPHVIRACLPRHRVDRFIVLS